MKRSPLLTLVVLPPVLLGLAMTDTAQVSSTHRQVLEQQPSSRPVLSTQADKAETRVVVLDVTGMT